MGEKKAVGAVLVVGGGIAGVQASLDLAESGYKAYLVERTLSIGGTMAQLDKTFPTNDCSMCILSPKLVDCGRHRNIELLTYSEVDRIEGEAGNFRVWIKKHPRYVDLEKCKACGDCAEACPVQFPNDYEQGLSPRSAIYHPFDQATPATYGIDKRGIPPCRATCPLHVNAQGYIALISLGKFKEALELVRERTPFPGITGRICHHPCESKCERREVDEPIAIDLLKRFVADQERQEASGKGQGKGEKEQEVEPPPPRPERVAIVGSGPAGLLCAYDLAKLGYQVTIFEALPVAGGMLAVGIPEYRLPRDVLREEIEVLRELGVDIRLNTPIGEAIELDHLRADYRAVFIAVGCHISRRLEVSGEDLEGVIGAVEFLRKVNLGEKVEVGEKVAVIGGGNAAIDAARTVLRLGAKEVTIVYRRSRVEMPANEEEITEAENEGIKIHYLANPTQMVGKDGKLVQMECIRMELGEPDESGRRRPVPIEGSEFTIDVDMMIPAISQSPDLSFLKENHDLKLTRWNTFHIDPLTSETNLTGVFAGGDAVTGPNTYIDAMAAGRKAAVSIDRYLNGEDLRSGREEEGPQESAVEVEIEGVELKPRVHPVTLPVTDRLADFKEVCLGLKEANVIEEAKRCLSCGGCSECMECVKACEPEAIIHDMVEEVLELEVGSIILAPGFDEFEPEIKREYGYGIFPNVVTSIEFERILSASGPFKGEILRPSDKAHPKRLAWINCVGSRDPKLGRGYCSSVCCMYSSKEAVIAKEHSPDVEATIFYMDMRSYGKEFDKYVERAEKEYGVRYVRGRVSQVEEQPENQNLVLTYEDEEANLGKEEFDMVILSVGLDASKAASQFREKFDIELNNYYFARTSTFEPLKTNVPGIFVGGAFSGPKDVPETVAQASAVAAEAGSILSEARGSLIAEKQLIPEINVKNERPRIGAFICHCGINIGAYVDVPAVVEYTGSLPNVVYAEENLYTCSQDTQEKIKEMIKEHNLNRVVVASCTPRTHEPLFQDTIREAGLNRHLFEMANIRDQNSWVHMKEKEAATEKAKDLVRMAVAKARLIQPLETRSLSVAKKGLVIGGGVAGMTAALKLAEEGYESYLVEREAELGGMAREIYYTIEGDDVQKFLRELTDKVEDNPNITVFKESEIEKIDGFVGNFQTTVRQVKSEKSKVKSTSPETQDTGHKPQDAVEVEHGVVIVATGAKEYQSKEYLYGDDERVITQRQLEKMLSQDGSKKQEAGSKKSESLASGISHLASVVMIQCVGSRNEGHPYCSRVCCSEAVKNAIRLKELDGGQDVWVLYRDMRTYGFKEDYYQKARELGVTFLRFDEKQEPEVRKNGEGIEVLVREPLLGEKLLLEPDLLVLSTGTIPHPENEEIARFLKVPLNEDGFFLEAHMKLRPVDFATEGIFLCGLAHSPKFIEESICQANAAVSRACTILSKEMIETQGSVSQVDELNCNGCGLCVDVCPYKAIELVEKKVLGTEKTVAQLNEALCKGCGACSASCRSGSIDLKGFTDEEICSEIEGFAQRVELAA